MALSVTPRSYLGGVLEDGAAFGNPVSRQYDRDANIDAGKATWTMAQNHTLVGSVFGDPTERDGWLTNPNADPGSALRLEKTGSHNLNVKYNAILSPTWLLEVSSGRHWERSGLEPATDEGRTVPRQVDETLGQYERGGFQRVQDDTAYRGAFAVKLSNVCNRHELRYGFDLEANHYAADLQETWYRFFGPSGGFASYIQERNYAVQGAGHTRNMARFAQDAWRIASNLQLNLGIRYEQQRLDSANGVAISGQSDAEACTAHGECRTVSGLSLTNNWAPRLGASWDPLGNGRAKVYAFWGRFYEAIPLDMNIRAINGERDVITQHVSNTPLSSATFFNPTGYVIANPGEGFFGARFDKPSRSYRALELTVQKAVSDRWHLNSSFVYARARGNHEGLYMSGYDQLDPNITALYDIPSFLPNSDGRLRADKPYQFKLFAAYAFDCGLTLSESFMLSAGVPISAQGPEIVNGYGDGTIFLQPRGSQGRTPSFRSFDLHADYRLPLANARNISVIVDIFNLFNQHQVLEVDQDYIYEGMNGIGAWEVPSNLDEYGNPRFNSRLPASTFFGTPILFQAPRSVQIGLKFTF